MKVLIKSAEIIDKNSSWNKIKKNILIENGKIARITDEALSADQVVEGNDLKVSIGWFDMRTSIKDPGYEHKEDILSASAAAAFGGFTELACTPNTKPAIQTKDVVGYIRAKAAGQLVEIHPIASVTVDNKGQELTEMIDLHHSGAVAFSDGERPIWHSDVFLKSLQYLQLFDGLLIDHPEDLHLTHSGQMNEGIVSTTLGLKGIPKIAEEVIVERDLKILEYTGGKLHVARITSPVSVALIRKAKEKGLKVTCDTAFYHLLLDDSMLTTFDTNLKVNPPLRTMADIDALWSGVADGTIDVIVTDHNPQDSESKNLEFDLADFGMIGLETFFGSLNKNSRLPLYDLIEKFAQRPREILGISMPVIEEGSEANLTVFDPTVEWEFTEKDIRSKSRNSPFIRKGLKGKVRAVFNKSKFVIHN